MISEIEYMSNSYRSSVVITSNRSYNVEKALSSDSSDRVNSGSRANW